MKHLHSPPPAVRQGDSLHPFALIPPFLLTLLQSLRLPITPFFSSWRQGMCDDRGVSTGHGDPLPWLFPLAGRVDTFLPLSVSINLFSVLSGSTFLPIKSFYCPASQGSGYTGLWSRRKVCVNVSLIFHLPPPSTQITQIPHCVSFPQYFYFNTNILNCALCLTLASIKLAPKKPIFILILHQ